MAYAIGCLNTHFLMCYLCYVICSLISKVFFNASILTFLLRYKLFIKLSLTNHKIIVLPFSGEGEQSITIYHHKKLNWRSELKTWTKLFPFYFGLILSEKT